MYAETVDATGRGDQPAARQYLPALRARLVGPAMDASRAAEAVRYADDFLLTFERHGDADRMATALAERLAKFGLRLHEDETRLIEFRRFAATNRRLRSGGRPETFNFLGFTHCWKKTLDGRFMVPRKTQRAWSAS